MAYHYGRVVFWTHGIPFLADRNIVIKMYYTWGRLLSVITVSCSFLPSMFLALSLLLNPCSPSFLPFLLMLNGMSGYVDVLAPEEIVEGQEELLLANGGNIGCSGSCYNFVATGLVDIPAYPS